MEDEVTNWIFYTFFFKLRKIMAMLKHIDARCRHVAAVCLLSVFTHWFSINILHNLHDSNVNGKARRIFISPEPSSIASPSSFAVDGRSTGYRLHPYRSEAGIKIGYYRAIIASW